MQQHHGFGQGDGGKHDPFLLPAGLQVWGDKELLKTDDRLLFGIEQGSRAEGERRVAQPYVNLPQRQLQAIVLGQPAGQIALDQTGGLPQQQGDQDKKQQESVGKVAQQAELGGRGLGGVHLVHSHLVPAMVQKSWIVIMGLRAVVRRTLSKGDPVHPFVAALPATVPAGQG